MAAEHRLVVAQRQTKVTSLSSCTCAAASALRRVWVAWLFRANGSVCIDALQKTSHTVCCKDKPLNLNKDTKLNQLPSRQTFQNIKQELFYGAHNK
eukprot:scaffold210698_cov26-Prasinocladus_malaysianus.AAC.1